MRGQERPQTPGEQSRNTKGESADVADLMGASLAQQGQTLSRWGLEPAGLLMIMSACFNRCFFCSSPAVNNPPPSFITRWEQIRDHLKGNTEAGLSRLYIGGTEPTSHPHLEDALQLCHEVGLTHVELMTSGLGFDDRQRTRRWVDWGLTSIALPIYAAEAALHDQITGTENFSRLMRSLDVAREEGIEVHIHTLALRRNLHALPRLAEKVREDFGGRLTVGPVRAKGRLFRYSEEVPSMEEVGSVLEGVDCALVGWPACVAPDLPRDAAGIIQIYFRGQERTFGQKCTGCAWKSRCPGVVGAELEARGEGALCPR